MNSSYETEFNKTNIFMKDIITETDNKSINTNLSNLNIGILSSNKFLFKGSLTDQKQLGSTLSLPNEILKDTSSLGFTKIRKTDKEKLNNKLVNLNMEKYQNSWIEICSKNISKIILIKVVDQCYFEGHLHLKNNLNNEYILVKFINKKYYNVITPSIFFIKPRNEIIINIKRFSKIAPDTPSNKLNDTILMIAKKTNNKIDDLNDVKIYLKDDDIYSQNYQLFSFSLILDNGYNPIYYNKLIEDRKKSIETFYNKININEIKNNNTIKEHIEDMKINIGQYKNKIRKIEMEYETTMEKKEIQNIEDKQTYKPDKINKIIVNKEEFFEVMEDDSSNKLDINPKELKKTIFDTLHDENGVTIPMILFLMSLGLFLGKLIKVFLFK